MEKSNMTKWMVTILILIALAAIGFAFSLLKPDSGRPRLFEGAQGDYGDTASKVDDETERQVRDELAAPESPLTDTEKVEVREELSKPSGGELSEEEKERIRAELRK